MENFRNLRNKAFKNTKEEMKRKLVRRDNVIVQAVKTVDLIDKGSNLMAEQLKEWYALYFPELGRLVVDNEKYAQIVSELKTRSSFTETNIENVLGKKDIVRKIAQAAKESMGAELTETDIKAIAGYAANIENLRKERREIEVYVENVMNEEAKNVSAITGSVIGARLIAAAGSLERLANMPSSTVQVLGAERALFSHLKKGTPSQKYGIIFQYPKLRGAPMKVRGKIARKLASKLSIAAKLDFFKGTFIGDKMKREIDELANHLIERDRK